MREDDKDVFIIRGLSAIGVIGLIVFVLNLLEGEDDKDVFIMMGLFAVGVIGLIVFVLNLLEG